MPPYRPPPAGSLPRHGKEILAAAYISSREGGKGKVSSAKIAWAAVEKFGYHKDVKGRWVK
jgi:cation transport regulator ChaB